VKNECRFYCPLHFSPWSKYRGRLNTIDILSSTPQFRAGRFILSLEDRAHSGGCPRIFKRPTSPYRLPIVPDNCRSILNQTREAFPLKAGSSPRLHLSESYAVQQNTQSRKMADHNTPSPQPDLHRNRLPSLFEVLSRRTLAPVDLFYFYIYMRDQQRSVDYLDFW
jgi:hypothetical protein